MSAACVKLILIHLIFYFECLLISCVHCNFLKITVTCFTISRVAISQWWVKVCNDCFIVLNQGVILYHAYLSRRSANPIIQHICQFFIPLIQYR